MNRLLKSAVYTLIILCVIMLQSGCESEADKMLDKGIEKFENADFAGAAKIYSEIIRKDSSNIDAYFKLASAKACIYNNQKMFMKDLSKGLDAAFKVYKSFKKIPGLKVSDNEDVSKILEIRNEVFSVKSQVVNLGNMPWSKEEIYSFSNAIKKNPKSPTLYFGRGLWYSIQGSINNSVRDFTSAIDLDKKFIQAYLARGRCYFLYTSEASRISSNFGSYRYKRIFDFKRALNINPNNIETLYEIGMTYTMNEHHKTAIEYFNRLLSLNPENNEALSLRVFCKAIVGDYVGAVDDLNVLVNRFPDNLEYLKELGHQKIMAGNREEGLKILRKAKTLCKDIRLMGIIQSLLDRYSTNKN